MQSMALRFLTAGDSHGDSLVGIIEGLPAGIPIHTGDIRKDLRRRRKSYGRSERQKIENDRVEIVSGLWRGTTTGAPVAIRIPNLGRTVSGRKGGGLATVPRPGHTDLAGCLKYGLNEVPPISERASARGTAMRVAIGAVAKSMLKHFAIHLLSHVRSIGGVTARPDTSSFERLRRRAVRSPIYCADGTAAKDMIAAIQAAQKDGHSLGGSAEVIAAGVPPGLGSHVEWDRRLEARLAGALMSIPSVKAVEIGDGLETYRRPGAAAQDAIAVKGGAFTRATNFAGGIEGGISNGENIIVRLYAKPIPTARQRVATIDMQTLRSCQSPYVRADVCVIPALGIIAESAVAWVLLCAFMEKFAGDHIRETEANFKAFMASLRKRSSR